MARAISRAGWFAIAERGSVDGDAAAGCAAVTSVAVRDRVLARGASSATEVAGDGLLAGETAAAVVAGSGRVVTRGWRLGVGVGVAATVGCGSAGDSRRCGWAVGCAVTSGVGSIVAWAICGLVVARLIDVVLAGVGSVGDVSWLGDGARSAAICARGVVTAWATSRLSVGVALVSGVGACCSVRRASCGVSASCVVVGSVTGREVAAGSAC